MDEENKRILVELQMKRAHRFLEQAEEMYSLQHWDLAANRYYYACYHAVQGLFISKGLPTAKKHAGVVSQFSLNFVKTGIVETVYGSFLARMMQLRQKADYNCAYDISQLDIDEYITLSKDFIKKMDELISCTQKLKDNV